jgi:fructose-1,6-bisphosphatase/inositol monophosphatase family enzyme
MMMDPEPCEFVIALAPALRQAAAIARALEGRVQNSPKSDEDTAVKQALTIADTASQEALLVALLERFPGVRLEAEEDTPTVSRFAHDGQALVVIDPIDGTLHSYLAGEGPYAVMIGLALEGQYRAGLVALPREGLFFEASRGAGARMARAGSPARPVRLRRGGDRVLVNHGMPPGVCAALRERGFEVIPACGGAVAVAPLIPGVRAGLRYAPGPLGISIRGRIGALIAVEGGALARSAGGEPFPLDLESPAPVLMVTQSEDDFAPLSAALSAAGLP